MSERSGDTLGRRAMRGIGAALGALGLSVCLLGITKSSEQQTAKRNCTHLPSACRIYNPKAETADALTAAAGFAATLGGMLMVFQIGGSRRERPWITPPETDFEQIENLGLGAFIDQLPEAPQKNTEGGQY